MSRRRGVVRKLPRGPALVAAGVLAFGCGKKTDEPQATPPQTNPPPDAAQTMPPQVAPADAATPTVIDATVVEDAAAAAPADAKRSLDNLPGKLKPVPDDRRIDKGNKAPQPKPPPPKAPVMPNKDASNLPHGGQTDRSTRPPLVGPFDRRS